MNDNHTQQIVGNIWYAEYILTNEPDGLRSEPRSEETKSMLSCVCTCPHQYVFCIPDVRTTCCVWLSFTIGLQSTQTRAIVVSRKLIYDKAFHTYSHRAKVLRFHSQGESVPSAKSTFVWRAGGVYPKRTILIKLENFLFKKRTRSVRSTTYSSDWMIFCLWGPC